MNVQGWVTCENVAAVRVLPSVVDYDSERDAVNVIQSPSAIIECVQSSVQQCHTERAIG